jgi:hypothetical protein
LLSHGLAFVHCSTPNFRPFAASVPPWSVSKPLTAQMVPPERNFFETIVLKGYRSIGI